MKASLFALAFAAGVAFAQDTTTTSAAVDASTTAAASTTASAALVSGASNSTSATGTRTGTATSKASAAIVTQSGSTGPIPSGISSQCTTYLQNLNTNTQFAACTAPLLKATNAFAPTANSTSSSSQATIVKTLDTLCAAPGCSDTFMRTLLSNFYIACKADLTSVALKDTYDIMYIMNPITKAICSKDGDTYCVIKAAQTAGNSTNAAGTSTSDNGDANVSQNAAVVIPQTDAEVIKSAVNSFTTSGIAIASVGKRVAAGQSVIKYAPNTQVYRDNGVPYLYTLPTLSSASLCTTCTKSILAAYASWEMAMPYALGLANSPMLGGQAELWSEVGSKCGSDYVASVQSEAGSEKVNSEASGASQIGISGSVIAAVAMVVGFFVAL